MATPSVTYPNITNTGANDANKVNKNFAAILSGLVGGTWDVSFNSAVVSSLSASTAFIDDLTVNTLAISPSIKTATNLGNGWYRIATAPAGNNVGVFRVTHQGLSKHTTLVFALSQAQGSSKPNVNVLSYDVSDR